MGNLGLKIDSTITITENGEFNSGKEIINISIYDGNVNLCPLDMFRVNVSYEDFENTLIDLLSVVRLARKVRK